MRWILISVGLLSSTACSDLPPAQTAQIVVSSSAQVLQMVAELLRALDDQAAKCQLGASHESSTPADLPAAD